MSPKNAAAVALGRKGGKARAERMTKEQRSQAARKAVEARWKKALDRSDKNLARTHSMLDEREARQKARKVREKKA